MIKQCWLHIVSQHINIKSIIDSFFRRILIFIATISLDSVLLEQIGSPSLHLKMFKTLNDFIIATSTLKFRSRSIFWARLTTVTLVFFFDH